MKIRDNENEYLGFLSMVSFGNRKISDLAEKAKTSNSDKKFLHSWFDFYEYSLGFLASQCVPGEHPYAIPPNMPMAKMHFDYKEPIRSEVIKQVIAKMYEIGYWCDKMDIPILSGLGRITHLQSFFFSDNRTKLETMSEDKPVYKRRKDLDDRIQKSREQLTKLSMLFEETAEDKLLQVSETEDCKGGSFISYTVQEILDRINLDWVEKLYTVEQFRNKFGL